MNGSISNSNNNQLVITKQQLEVVRSATIKIYNKWISTTTKTTAK